MKTESFEIAERIWIKMVEERPPENGSWFVLLDCKTGRTEICRWKYVTRPTSDLKYEREEIPSRLVTRFETLLDCDIESFSHWLPVPFVKA